MTLDLQLHNFNGRLRGVVVNMLDCDTVKKKNENHLVQGLMNMIE